MGQEAMDLRDVFLDKGLTASMSILWIYTAKVAEFLESLYLK
jgi:hypothetical protein